MWPGRVRSAGLVSGWISARTVAVRSDAEMPVVVPWRASTETVNAARRASLLSAAIRGKRNSSSRCPGSAAQMTPLVWRTMKAMASGVTHCAAMTRSPSLIWLSSVDEDDDAALRERRDGLLDFGFWHCCEPWRSRSGNSDQAALRAV